MRVTIILKLYLQFRCSFEDLPGMFPWSKTGRGEKKRHKKETNYSCFLAASGFTDAPLSWYLLISVLMSQKDESCFRSCSSAFTVVIVAVLQVFWRAELHGTDSGCWIPTNIHMTATWILTSGYFTTLCSCLLKRIGYRYSLPWILEVSSRETYTYLYI